MENIHQKENLWEQKEQKRSFLEHLKTAVTIALWTALLTGTGCVSDQQNRVDLAKKKGEVTTDFSKGEVVMPYVYNGDTVAIIFSPVESEKITYKAFLNDSFLQENILSHTGETSFQYQVGDLLDAAVWKNRIKVPEKAQQVQEQFQLLNDMRDFGIEIVGNTVKFRVVYEWLWWKFPYEINISQKWDKSGFKVKVDVIDEVNCTTVDGETETIEEAFQKVIERFGDFLKWGEGGRSFATGDRFYRKINVAKNIYKQHIQQQLPEPEQK